MKEYHERLIADARSAIGRIYADSYMRSDGSLCPADFLMACMEERTMRDPHPFWVQRFNDIADAYFAAITPALSPC